VITFFKQIFTWWYKQTLSTFFYTLLNGNFAGKDEFGNKYYSNSKGKRWVIFSGEIDSSKITSEWYSWTHYLTNKIPTNNLNKYKWQKINDGNLTGTSKAHKPDGLLSSNSKKNMKKYESWET